jgi:hypothetical protein
VLCNRSRFFCVSHLHIYCSGCIILFRWVIIRPSAPVTHLPTILNSGRISESKRNFGANQWSFNLWVNEKGNGWHLITSFSHSFVCHLGTVNVRLPKHEDHYRWNKVTTCVHNLFGGQRWVDQYGDLIITNNKGIRCKLNFAKASYWSSNRYEVVGSVTDPNGKLVHHLFGNSLDLCTSLNWLCHQRVVHFDIQ